MSKVSQLKNSLFPLLYLGICVLPLVGCGGTEFKYSSSQTHREHNYLDSNERIEEASGLEAVAISSGGTLSGSIRRWGLMPEKAAPIVKTDTIQVTKANPVGASAITLLTIGIYPLINPKDAWSTTVGKEQLTRSDESPDFSKARRTGRSQWQELRHSRQERVTISTGGVTLQRYIHFSFNQTPTFNFDISDWIKQQIKAQDRDEIFLFISCDCRNSSSVSALSVIRDLRFQVQIPINRNSHAWLFPQLKERSIRGGDQKPERSKRPPELIQRF